MFHWPKKTPNKPRTISHADGTRFDKCFNETLPNHGQIINGPLSDY